MADNVTIDELTPGMVIVSITRQDGPVKIRKSGLVTGDAMVQGLKEMGVKELAIDPDQTVAIEDEAASPSLSDTQKLFANTTTAPNPPHSEPYQRSLFMPSVQSLPAPWQYYGRRAGLLALMLAGGFALGWLLATWSRWWPAVNQPEPAVSSVPGNQAEKSDQSPPLTQSNALATKGETHQVAKTSEPDSTVRQDTSNQNTPSASSNEQQPAAETAPTAASRTEKSDENAQTITPKAQRQASNDANGDAVSPELLQKFEQAVAAIDSDTDPAPAPETTAEPEDEVIMVHELPAWLLTDLPTMRFSAHMYASEPGDRWVNVNGKELGEGDTITEGLRIVSIEPQYVILAFRGHQFSMRALTDW